MFLLRMLILSISLLFSTYSFSLSDNTIFYPMSIHTDGQYITAQQLFLRDDGALWMYDVYGQVHLFDGQNIFTLGERSNKESPRRVVFVDNKFWFIKNNKLKSWSESTGFNIVLDLPEIDDLQVLNQQDGTLWGYNDNHFFIYDTKKMTFITSNINEANTGAILDEITITGAVYAKERWIVSTSEGIFEFDPISKTYAPLYLGYYIDAIFYSKKTNQIILGTHDSIWLAKIQNNEIDIQHKIISDLLLSFTETDRFFWFGTASGLYKWNTLSHQLDRFESVVRDDYSLEGDKIYALLSDNNNGVWIATDNGVSYYSDSTRLFTRIRHKEANGNLNVDKVNAVLQSSNDSSWFGAPEGLFLIPMSNKKKSIKKILPYYVNDLSYDEEFIWVGTTTGIYQVESDSFVVRTPEELKGLEGENIEHLLMDSTGILWFSSKEGLFHYNTNTNRLMTLGYSWALEKKYSTTITHIYENKNGQISIGTNTGLYRYANGALTFDYAYIRTGSVLDMVDTEYGNSWIVSNYGLQISNSKGERSDVMLSANYITPHCVLSSNNGVWLSSSKGLSLYTHSGRLTKHFGSQRGLINNELLPDLCSISSNGTMMFVSKDGIFFVNEQDLVEYQIPKPRAVLGQVRIDHKAVSYGGKQELESLVPYGSSISFLFGILPEFQNTSLSYQLLGSSDESWQDFDGSLLIFDSLKSGKYVLRINPRNDGQRTSYVTEFSFHVEIPWFFAPWFIFTLFCIGLLSIIGIYSWRSKEIKKSNENLRKSVDIKTKQLSHQGKALISSNRQLQKLLTVRQHVISEMAEQALQPIKDIQNDLHKKGSLTNLALANQCEYSLKLLRQLSHIEPLMMLQQSKRMNQLLSPLLRAAIKGWEEEYHFKGVNLCLDDHSVGCSIFVQPILIDAIFNNVLFNLLKRSDLGEQVTICIENNEQRISIRFLSQGSCITAEELEELKRVDLSRIIEVINQALGLSSVKQLTVQNGGHFEITKNIIGANELLLSWPIAIDSFSSELSGVKLENKDTDDLQRHQDWLIRVYEIVEENYRSPKFGTSAAAKALFVSERNLQRRFKQLTQRSFMEYLIEVKLEKACELLISGCKVADAAFESGFNDPSYFSKRFKRHYGLSPTQFVSENEES
uniref:HTH-type transcriptional regulator YesS n=1 Tax=Aliivibrio wodanis TaxID=80852 RepID=A0A5Q4ZWQ9_9GAMM|nr:HTH-type transcriptional regulator YesS [Aliivibrio wodanis]